MRFKEGGGVRDVSIAENDNTSVTSLIEKGAKLFFPGGVSKKGPLSSMDCCLGNFSQEKMEIFTNLDGNECDFFTYLKSHSLFASRCFVYLMTSGKCESEGEMENDDEKLLTLEHHLPLAESTRTSSFTSSKRVKSLYTVCDSNGKLLCSDEEYEEHYIAVTYERFVESSYSEVISRHQCVSKSECFEASSMLDPEIIEKAEEYDPLDEGFSVIGIEKDGVCFLQQLSLTLDQSGNNVATYHYPNAPAEEKQNIILHHPSEVWGFDGDELVIGVVSSKYMSDDASYSWHRDGVEIKTGKNCCCIFVRSSGKYTVTVHHGSVSETSQCIEVRKFPDISAQVNVPESGSSNTESGYIKESTSGSNAANTDKNAESYTSTLPIVKKSDFYLNINSEIGRGTFGTVFKGTWAGTSVAIKRIKCRRASKITSALKSEVLIHSMLRHPNIVQIMAISMERNELYIISELVDGPNLEEFIFFEEDDQSRIKVTPELKDSIGKNCAQAVAYLHALVPPVIHRDIKPANVLVSRQTGVAKLCDMGISKLKELQTLNQTTSGIPGTPSYMAPECLLLNERATVYSDIWSLACTLLELYTGKECWEIDETNTLNDEMPCNMLKRKLQNHDQPSHLESVQIPMKEVIRKCFNYTPSLRPSALDMIAVYNTPNI